MGLMILSKEVENHTEILYEQVIKNANSWIGYNMIAVKFNYII